MKTKALLALALPLFAISTFGQDKSGAKNKKETVSLEIVETDNTVKKIEFEWPYPPGPLPVGGEGNVVEKVEKICKENNIDCPPVRQKVSENVWLCSNGKKIRTNTPKLSKLLSKAWDQ